MNMPREVICLAVGVFFAVFFISPVVAFSDIDANSLFVKVALQSGSNITRMLAFSSVSGGTFKIAVKNLEGVSVSEDFVVISPGSSKNVGIVFDSSDLNPGVSVGSIYITDGYAESSIPVVFEVQSTNVRYGVTLEIPPLYSDVKAGDKVVAQVKILDLLADLDPSVSNSSTVQVEYAVYSGAGNVLSLESEQVSFEKQILITKTLILPSSFEPGDYIFAIVASSGNSSSTSSRLFRVDSSNTILSFLFREHFVFTLAVLLLVLLGVFTLLFVRLVRTRDKMIGDLKKYNAWESQKYGEILAERSRLLNELEKRRSGSG